MKEEKFSWSLPGRVIVVDNGPVFATTKKFKEFMGLDTFSVIAFDPTGRAKEEEGLGEFDEFQLFPHATLGTGQPGTLYTCLSESMSGTLEPLAPVWLSPKERDGSQVLAKIPISTVALDLIEGLPAIDWLLLDDRNDSVAILEHGGKALADTLLIQVSVPLRPTHRGQPDIAQVSHWMARQGFRFYRFQRIQPRSNFPDGLYLDGHQATEMVAVIALFVPTEERLATLSMGEKLKLSFILHSVYKIHDYCYHVLNSADPAMAQEYLKGQGYLRWIDRDEDEFVMNASHSPDIWSNVSTHLGA